MKYIESKFITRDINGTKEHPFKYPEVESIEDAIKEFGEGQCVRMINSYIKYLHRADEYNVVMNRNKRQEI